MSPFLEIEPTILRLGKRSDGFLNCETSATAIDGLELNVHYELQLLSVVQVDDAEKAHAFFNIFTADPNA